MGNSIWDLFVTLRINPDDFNKGIDSAVGKSNSAGKSIVGNLSAIGGSIVMGSLAAASVGVVALGGFMIASTKAAADAENIQAQLASVLKSTGGAAGVTADQVNNLANLYGRLTKFEDDQIVSGQNMLLTFTNIGSNVFPQATVAMLNMSQAMGTDLKSSAIQLGKALNNPTEGMSALTRVGVAFTEAQKKQVEELQKAGKMEQAQAIILKELEIEFGGAAKAAGQTFAGQLTILQNSFGNIQETIGGAMLPVLTQLAASLTTTLADPAVQAGIATLTAGVAAFAVNVITNIPKVISWFQQVGDWLANNQGVIVGVFAALGTAVAVWAVTTVIAMAPVIAGFLPVIAVMAVVGVAAKLLYDAWQTKFGGIREKTAEAWTFITGVFNAAVAFIMPIVQGFLNSIQQWWSDNGASIVATAQAAWSTIQGAIATVAGIIQGIVGAFLAAIKTFWDENGAAILAAATTAWNAIQAIVATVTSVISSIFAAFKSAFEGDWRGFGENLRTAWDTAWNAIKGAVDMIWPVIKGIVVNAGTSIITWFSTQDWGKIGGDIVRGIASGLTAGIGWLADAARNVAQAAWNALQGFNQSKSPSKLYAGEGRNMAMGLAVGINQASSVPEKAMERAAANTYNRAMTINVSPHYYKGDEPTLTSELSMIAAMAAYQ